MVKQSSRFQGLSPLRRVRLFVSRMINKARCLRYSLFGVRVGKNTFISSGAWIDCYRGNIIIGDNCRITHGAKILSHDQTLSRLYDTDKNLDISGTTTLEDNVFIGMNSIVLPNVTIGAKSIVGAAVVVSESVPAGVVVVGNPMRIVKKWDPARQEWVPVDKAEEV